MTFGDKLKFARESAKLKQSDLAKLISTEESKISNTTISNWEKGISKPYVDILPQICKSLNVDANWLLGFNPDEIKKEPAIDKTASSIQSILFDKLGRQPTPNEIEKFQAFSEGYIKGLGESGD